MRTIRPSPTTSDTEGSYESQQFHVSICHWHRLHLPCLKSRGQKHAGIGHNYVDISILRNTDTFWKEVYGVEFHGLFEVKIEITLGAKKFNVEKFQLNPNRGWNF